MAFILEVSPFILVTQSDIHLLAKIFSWTFRLTLAFFIQIILLLKVTSGINKYYTSHIKMYSHCSYYVCKTPVVMRHLEGFILISLIPKIIVLKRWHIYEI